MKITEVGKLWKCPHCKLEIRVGDPIDVVDHCLDFHREVLIRDKPAFPLIRSSR